MSGILAVLVASVKSLIATVSPSSLDGIKSGSGTVVTSQAVTVTPSGGQTPYTYLWTYVSGDTEVVPTSSTLATTTFRAFRSSPGIYSASYKCVVDDAVTSIDSSTVTITLESF